MAGGVGSRFWPVSRNSKPKQFLDILGVGRTFLQMTFDRFSEIVPSENILVVTSEQYKGLVAEQLPQLKGDHILLEPFMRNTAPCIAYATYKIYAKNPEATVVIAPSDHLITGEENFRNTILRAMDNAAISNDLFTIGIKPTRPDTNYGYIQINRNNNKIIGEHSAYAVKTFTEKPSSDLAQVFLDSGEFFWNSGMFIWRLESIMMELKKCLPQVAELFEGGLDYYYTHKEQEYVNKVYADCPVISIDFGVMEKTKNAWVFLSNFGWSDVGTWNSIYERSPNKDAKGNIIKAQNFLVGNVKGTIVKENNPKKLVVVKNLENFIVVDTEDVLLISPREDRFIKDTITELSINEKLQYL